MAFIYVITNDVNGKQYVGKTGNSIEQRFKEHIKDSKKRRCEKRPLYVAMNKYGIEHFFIELLEECSAEDSSEREIYWIKTLNTYGHNGYNATLGGDSKYYYDYNELSQAYLELGRIEAVCNKYKCSDKTVRRACKECGIPINTDKNIKKAVFMLDKETEEIIKSFPSCSEAARVITGSNRAMSHISEVCNGKRKTAYGYKWEWYNED